MPLAAEMGTGVIVMEPPGAGMLGRRLKAEPGLSPLRAYGVDTWAQALLAWVIADVRVSWFPSRPNPRGRSQNARVGPPSLLPSEMRATISRQRLSVAVSL